MKFFFLCGIVFHFHEIFYCFFFSITGYLNGRGRWRPSSHAPHHSTLSTCADSLSPYATTHVSNFGFLIQTSF